MGISYLLQIKSQESDGSVPGIWMEVFLRLTGPQAPPSASMLRGLLNVEEAEPQCTCGGVAGSVDGWLARCVGGWRNI